MNMHIANDTKIQNKLFSYSKRLSGKTITVPLIYLGETVPSYIVITMKSCEKTQEQKTTKIVTS